MEKDKMTEWRTESPDLNMRIDKAIRNLHRNEIIDDFFYCLERIMSIWSVLKKVDKLSDYAFKQYEELYMTVLGKYIDSSGDLSSVPKNINDYKEEKV